MLSNKIIVHFAFSFFNMRQHFLMFPVPHISASERRKKNPESQRMSETTMKQPGALVPVVFNNTSVKTASQSTEVSVCRMDCALKFLGN